MLMKYAKENIYVQSSNLLIIFVHVCVIAQIIDDLQSNEIEMLVNIYNKNVRFMVY